MAIIRWACAMALALLALAPPAPAAPIAMPAGFAPLQASCADKGGGDCIPIDGGWAFSGAAPLTVGTAAAAGRSLSIACTAAGNVSLTFADASVLVVPVTVGLSILPFAITTVNSAGTTATCSYANLK